MGQTNTNQAFSTTHIFLSVIQRYLYCEIRPTVPINIR